MKVTRLPFAVVFVICIASLFSCSKDLTRPKAAKLIETQQRLPRPQTITFPDSYLRRICLPS